MAWRSADRICPYLDGTVEPFYHVELGYTMESDAKSTDSSDTDYSELEILTSADLAYFHNVAYGDLDLSVRFDNIFPLGSASFDPPTHLVELVLDAHWLWRYVNHTALELRLEPGLYTSTEEILDMPLAMPVTVAGIYTADPSLAFIGGLQIRPGFNQIVLPYGGVVWQPHPKLRLEAMVPEARVIAYLDHEWSGYAGWSWENITYHMAPDWSGRNRLTLNSQEYYLGVTRTMHDELHMYGALGWAVDREAIITRSRSGSETTIPVDNALVLRFGVSGAF